MFVLAHRGITLGAVWLIDHLIKGGGNASVDPCAVSRTIVLTLLGSNLQAYWPPIWGWARTWYSPHAGH